MRKKLVSVYSLAAGGLVAMLSQDAGAITRRTDVDSADTVYKAYANNFPAVGHLNYTGNGLVTGATLITPEWALTAGHCILPNLSSFTVGGNTYTIDLKVTHPTWAGNPLFGIDLGLVHLSAPVPNVTPVPWYTGSSEVGASVDVVGFGGSGTGTTGSSAAQIDGIKRAGTNVVDATAMYYTTVQSSPGVFYPNFFGSAALANSYLVMDFDDPSNADGLNVMGGSTPTSLEMGIYDGDSGGGMFANFGSGPVLIGVNDYKDTNLATDIPPGDGTANASYADISGFVRVSAANTWITATVPEPGSLSVAAGALVFLMGRRKRSS